MHYLGFSPILKLAMRPSYSDLLEENRRLREENQALKGRLSRLEAELAKLREENEKLRARIKGDSPPPVKPVRRGGKRPGRKPGHPPANRPLPIQVDEGATPWGSGLAIQH